MKRYKVKPTYVDLWGNEMEIFVDEWEIRYFAAEWEIPLECLLAQVEEVEEGSVDHVI